MKKGTKTVSGNIVDLLGLRTFPGTLKISEGRIAEIIREDREFATYILPGFVDSHIHIESSMLVPSEFARLAVIHGTVAVVSDPHEIANVLGIDGIRYMIRNGRQSPLKLYFGAPSCVPATTFETSGAVIDPEQVEELLKTEEIRYLSEMMNFPGVINDDPVVGKKIEAAKKYAKPIDGHAPGLRGKDLKKYIEAGISTDHECLTKEEALEKIGLGMKIQIREGSAAKNFAELIPIIEEHAQSCMFASDDKHPDDLIKGHINELVKRALKLGYDRMKVLRCACLNPVSHYGLDIGLLQKDDRADFVVIDNFEDFNILKTYINGEKVAENGRALFARVPAKVVNNFQAKKKEVADFQLRKAGETINVIVAIDGQLITERIQVKPKIVDGYLISDTRRDILKIAVVNRYRNAPVAIGFIKGFGLREGAISTSVAHDSHNIVAVGVANEDICRAVNKVIENRGGLAVACGDLCEDLPLPVAGLMSDKDGFEVARQYNKLDSLAKGLGSKLKDAFMTLSFMALLVIPKIKLSDKGLFDGERFELIH